MVFGLLLSFVLALVHLYLWMRLVRDTRPSPMSGRAATVALCLLWLSIPLTLFFFRHARVALSPARFAYIWLGLMFYLFALLGCWDGLRMPLWVASRLRARARGRQRQSLVSDRSVTSHDIDREPRRVFVARTAAVSALVATGGIGAWGMRSALWEITTPELAVVLPRLPRALCGYTIALLSDVHIGPTLDGRFLKDVVERTNAMKPDLVAITGDLVDDSVARIGGQVAELSRLKARDGVCFVTGNHEYYAGAADWIAFLRTLGIRVLMNERIALGDSSPKGARFDLAGVPDHSAGRLLGPAADAVAAAAGRDPERALVMLAHQPMQIADVARTGADLQLSGHTHGGQLYPFGALTLLAQPYIAGLHRYENSGTQVYVSRGTGFWGPPMRVMAPAEIARIRLVNA